MTKPARALEPLDIESGPFLETVLNASSDCIKVLSLDGKLVFMNSGGMDVMEIDDFGAVRGCPWPSFWEGEHNVAAVAALDKAQAGETGHFVGLANTYKQTLKWWDVTVTPIFGRGGTAPTHILSISRDITIAKIAELQRELLAGELNHRVKNLLAVVGAIASQTFRGVSDARVDSFTARLMALSEAQSLLVETAWLSAPIGQVVAKALLPHAPDGRATFGGPSLELPAKQALALALAIHELATNAVKYGAFSNATGVVDLSWTLDGNVLMLRWRENGGPPVAPPTTKGFGSRIITRNLASEFRGEVDLQHPASGLVLTLTASL